MDYILKYRGETVLPYARSAVYNKENYVEYEGIIFKSKVNLNINHIPTSYPSYWERIGRIGYGYKTTDDFDKKSTTVKVNNNRTGDLTADNVVIYGNHTGNISASGEKSVVVIFGDVTGDITANQVIRLDKSNIEAGKHLINGIGD